MLDVCFAWRASKHTRTFVVKRFSVVGESLGPHPSLAPTQCWRKCRPVKALAFWEPRVVCSPDQHWSGWQGFRFDFMLYVPSWSDQHHQNLSYKQNYWAVVSSLSIEVPIRSFWMKRDVGPRLRLIVPRCSEMSAHGCRLLFLDVVRCEPIISLLCS